MKTVITTFLSLVGTLLIGQVEFCGPTHVDQRQTVSAAEVDAWISFFTSKHNGKNVDTPRTKLTTAAICSYVPISGVHEIYPEGSEQLYSMQVYVPREGKTYRYMFSFAGDKRGNDKIKSVSTFFSEMKITKYYIARVDDSRNTNPLENIIKNGRTDAFRLQR